MKLRQYPGAKPFYTAVFFSAVTQMGLFIHFLRWLSTIYSDGTSFLWRSLLFQLAMFLPGLFMMPAASFIVNKMQKGKAFAWSAVGTSLALTAIAVLFLLDCPWVAFGLTGVFGVFYAIMAPARVSVLKEIFDGNDLVKANGWYMIFYVLGFGAAAISAMILTPEPTSLIAYDKVLFLVLGASVLTTFFAFFVKVGQQNDNTKFRSPIRIFTATWGIPTVRMAILGLSAFWGAIQILLLLVQSMTRHNLTNTFNLSTNGFYASVILTAVGFLVGAKVAYASSKGFVETGIIPFASVAAAIVMMAIPFVTNDLLQAILYGVLGLTTSAAFVILRTVIQNFTKPDTAGRIHSVSYMIQMSVLVILMGGQTLLLIFTSLQVRHCFWILGIVLALTFIFTLRSTPMALLRAGLRFTFAFIFRYRVKVMGVENIPESGPLLLVGPHFSFIDWAVLQMACPRSLRIASNRNTFADWYQRWLLHGKALIEINRRDPAPAMEEIRQALLQGEAVVIFPEGEVSKTPHVSKFSLSYTAAVKDTSAQIVPFYIQGLWGSRYSHASDSVMRPQYFNRIISVGFGNTVPAETSEEDVRDMLRTLSAKTWDLAMDHYKTIVPLWLRAMRKRRNRPILIDPAGRHVSGFDMIRLVHNFSTKIKSVAKNDKHVGFMLPTSRDAALGIVSILATGKASVNLNYTAPADVVMGCIKKADISVVVTSHPFFDKLCTKNPAFEEVAKTCKMVYLDDEENNVGWINRIYSTVMSRNCPRNLLNFLWFKNAKLNDTALILFSSGSEGTPKGVVLTHKNIITNAQQCDNVIRLCRTDVMTCELPLFHSFGFTMTFMMPLLDGVPMVLCPDPTDIKTLARVCAQYKTTILMGTPTFLRAIAINRWVHPMCLDTLRFIVGGAEKVRQELRDTFKLKFGKDIYEAYGSTELSPLATINYRNVLLDDFLTMEKCNDLESVGQPIPGTIVGITDPETNEFLPQGSEGMVTVAGAQVMTGYLKDKDKTDSVVFEHDGLRWYKTGDKGKLTPDGFVQILGRYSRFAKLGGEMISLIAVETRLHETGLVEGLEYSVVAVPDSVKGERIVLLVNGNVDPEELSRNLRKSGMPPLMIPGSVFKVDSIPKLGSGKWDFTNMKKLAIQLMEDSKK